MPTVAYTANIALLTSSLLSLLAKELEKDSNIIVRSLISSYYVILRPIELQGLYDWAFGRYFELTRT